ncbi:hypothetical protein N2152v2_001030 [Parachlorella kessleri]
MQHSVKHWSPSFCADIRPQGDLWASQADEPCFARPRGYKRAVLNNGDLACLVYRPGNGGHAPGQAAEFGNICQQFSSYNKGGFACDQDLQRRTGTPYSVGSVYILASKAQAGSDPSQQDLWISGAGQPLAMLPYDDCSPDHSAGQGFLQHKYYNDTGPLDRARPCRGCFTIPTTLEEGLWAFQWLYEMNKDEWYSTCWDAVISDTGDSYTAPAANLPAPNPRSDSLGDAGIAATYGWSAAPLNQVSSSPPKCPAGMSGQFCSPGAG